MLVRRSTSLRSSAGPEGWGSQSPPRYSTWAKTNGLDGSSARMPPGSGRMPACTEAPARKLPAISINCWANRRRVITCSPPHTASPQPIGKHTLDQHQGEETDQEPAGQRHGLDLGGRTV